jgi:molybdate transport system regulatory protein
MKISVRNVFTGTISHLETGAVNAEFAVGIAGGQKMTAIVTNASVKSVGLAIGTQVSTLVKASSVLVSVPVDGSGLRSPTRNRLAGTVQSVTEGVVDAELSIALPGGVLVRAMITKDSVKILGLMPATAPLGSWSVILALIA